MINCFKAIFYKEFLSIKGNKKTFLLPIIIFYLVFIGSGIKNVHASNDDTKMLIAFSYVFYTSIFISFVAMVSTLKFWKEKAMHTLDSLLCIPFRFKEIFISKALFSTLIGTFCAFAIYIISTLVFFAIYGFNILSTINLLTIIFFSFFLNLGYSIINGFSMWSMKEGAAKIMQLMTYIIYIAGISGIIKANISSAITKETYIVLATATFILNIIALFCICIIDKEKVVLLKEL